MNDRPEKIQCSACFEPGDNIVQEAFSEQVEMLLRFSSLFLASSNPALCQKPSGACYVCHRKAAGQGKAG